MPFIDEAGFNQFIKEEGIVLPSREEVQRSFYNNLAGGLVGFWGGRSGITSNPVFVPFHVLMMARSPLSYLTGYIIGRLMKAKSQPQEVEVKIASEGAVVPFSFIRDMVKNETERFKSTNALLKKSIVSPDHHARFLSKLHEIHKHSAKNLSRTRSNKVHKGDAVPPPLKNKEEKIKLEEKKASESLAILKFYFS